MSVFEPLTESGQALLTKHIFVNEGDSVALNKVIIGIFIEQNLKVNATQYLVVSIPER